MTRRTTLARWGWRRTDGNQGKIGARYRHHTGYWIEHCGHPTALQPWALMRETGTHPSGDALVELLGAHRTLELAAAAHVQHYTRTLDRRSHERNRKNRGRAPASDRGRGLDRRARRPTP